MSRYVSCMLLAAVCATARPSPATEATLMGLEDIHRRIAAAHPRIAAAEAAARAAADRARIAGRPADPELEFEAESFGGSGGVSGFDAAETAIRLTQPLRPTGARDAEADGARQDANAAMAAAEIVRREARRDAHVAFHALASRQDLLALAEARLDRARRLHSIARDRASSGAASPLEALRAEADAGLAEAAVLRATGERERAAGELAALWGGTEDVRVASGPAAALPEPPESKDLRDALARHPVLAQAAAGRARAAAAHRAARAARWGDYGVMGGVQRFEETGDTGFTAGLSVVLPLWSRPGATAGAAALDLEAARQEEAASVLDGQSAAAAALSTYARARQAVLVLEQKSLPAARRMGEGMIEGYRAGKFGLAAVLEAQTAAADIEVEAVEAREEALKALADLEYWSPVGHEPNDRN